MGAEVVVRIQHHPSRSDLLSDLMASLGDLPVEVSSHAADPPNPWLGYYKCLTDIPESSHLLILQDDVKLCPRFPEAISLIAEANPDLPVCLFLARLPVRIARQFLIASKGGQRYFQTRFRINEFCPVLGILWPAHKAIEFKTWADANPSKLGHPAPRSDDGVLGRWCALTHQTMRFTVPCLVEHEDKVVSVIGKKAHWGKDRGRVSLQFLTGDPLDLVWS